MSARTAKPTWEAVLSFSDRPVVGIDEVGRGAWAGPVVAAAVILEVGTEILGLRDSKLLTYRQRIAVNRAIKRVAVTIGIGWVHAWEVDQHGLSWAIRESGLRALAAIEGHNLPIILDGRHNYLEPTHHSRALVGADARVVPVAAASVVAKVARDAYLGRYAQKYQNFGFEKHKGYGTKQHREAIDQFGITDIHRRSVAPIRRLVDGN